MVGSQKVVADLDHGVATHRDLCLAARGCPRSCDLWTTERGQSDPHHQRRTLPRPQHGPAPTPSDRLFMYAQIDACDASTKAPSGISAHWLTVGEVRAFLLIFIAHRRRENGARPSSWQPAIAGGLPWLRGDRAHRSSRRRRASGPSERGAPDPDRPSSARQLGAAWLEQGDDPDTGHPDSSLGRANDQSRSSP